MDYILLFSTTIFFGLLGGIVNGIREGIQNHHYWKAIVKGISASLLVLFFFSSFGVK